MLRTYLTIRILHQNHRKIIHVINRNFSVLNARNTFCKTKQSRSSLSLTTRSMSKVIDVWAQPAYRGLLENVPEVEQLLVKSKSPLISAAKDPHMEMGPAEIADILEHSGIDVAFMSAWTRPRINCVPNEVIHQYTKAYPDKFVGLGAVDLANPMKATAEVEKCVKEYGFKGIRILPWLWNLPPNSNVYYPVYAKCVELDIPVCMQVGHTGPMCPSDPGRPIPYLDEVALHFPDLKIVGGHIGYPWTNEMIALAWKYDNIYIDTSAYLPKYYPAELLHFMNTYGEDKVMFGTNWPMLPFHKCAKQAKELSLSNEAKEKFLWKNANRVFKLGLTESKVQAKL